MPGMSKPLLPRAWKAHRACGTESLQEAAIGYGDHLIASAQARGARARKRRIAFGDGKTIIWHRHAHDIFAGNPNVAIPGSEGAPDLEWIANFVGRRPYNEHDEVNRRWIWKPGKIVSYPEVFVRPEEREFAQRIGEKYVLIEPNVPKFKAVGPNKQWPIERFEEVASRLRSEGHDVVQLRYHPPYGPGYLLKNARAIGSPSFRYALAVLERAALYIGPEGGMHHGAAAFERPAVVLYGGFISPAVTGYAYQHNIFTGEGHGCGNLFQCAHCHEAMRKITVEEVLSASLQKLRQKEMVS